MSKSYGFKTEISALVNMIKSQFEARTFYQARKTGADFKEAVLTHEVKDNSLNFILTTRDETHVITVPTPYKRNGLTLIKSNEVERAVCNYYMMATDYIISYLDVIQNIFIGDYTGLVETVYVKKTIFVQQLAYGILNDNLSVVVYNLQKAINEVVNKMPLHETPMNSWMMNKRLMIVDPVFDSFTSPNDRLQYQIEKNRKFFDRGWTSIGLSDGSLADKNYILTEDIRKCTPFGLKHHNPQRNLYSTLGMKGDEYQNIRTETSQKLIDKGITRKGWNWFTAFIELPDVFEDQIVVDKRHANKSIVRERRFQCYGEILVKPNQELKFGAPMVRCSDGEIEYYKVKADKSWVDRIVEGETVVGGRKRKVSNVVVKFERHLKDGTKITNTHGNKGVIKLADLGHAIDPETNKNRPIDVIVCSNTPGKRKNYGQIIEALVNDIREREANDRPQHFSSASKSCGIDFAVVRKSQTTNTCSPLVIRDDITANVDEIRSKLMKRGFDKGLTWDINTYIKSDSPMKAVCGTVFWGVSKDVEDQLWDYDDTVRTNGRDLRTAGLKFSTVEFKALETVFGKDNPLMREILTYTQGTEIIEESLKILRSKSGVYPDDMEVKSVFDIKELDQKNGTMFTEKALMNTVADEFFKPKGFLLQLPVLYQTAIGNHKDFNYEGGVMLYEGQYDPSNYKAIYLTDKLYVPSGDMRRSWRHSTGLYGMSEIAVLINNVISLANRFKQEPENIYRIKMLYRAIGNYYARVSTMLGTKRGDISNYAMSVRYPFSAKAVAALSNTLPPNTVEIHKDMAKVLKVSAGDVVICERFPCLGFMGVRAQKVHITNDPMCKYVIRVSGNSLVSQNLDFDGDVIYLASFHSKEAKSALNKEWTNPNHDTWRYIDWLNNRKGSPKISCKDFDDYGITSFEDLTCDEHAQIVGNLTGVKAQTGPVIAMAYNLMRIMENSGVEITRSTEAGIEMFIEKAGQSVFEQKHGGQSLHDIVIDAICTADVETLVGEGFDPEISALICRVIGNKAASLGVYDLLGYHQKQMASGGSTIINRIVRSENKIYFASRSALEGIRLLDNLGAEEVDLPSRIFKMTTSGKYNGERTFLDKQRDNKLLLNIKDEGLRGACSRLFRSIDKSMGVVSAIKAAAATTKKWSEWRKTLWQLISTSVTSVARLSKTHRLWEKATVLGHF